MDGNATIRANVRTENGRKWGAHQPHARTAQTRSDHRLPDDGEEGNVEPLIPLVTRPKPLCIAKTMAVHIMAWSPRRSNGPVHHSVSCGCPDSIFGYNPFIVP